MKNFTHIYIILAAVLMFGACDPKVELCYDEHPHRSFIDFKFNWESGAVPPDTMMVMAYRRINTLKYAMAVTAKPADNTGRVILPVSEIDVDVDTLGNPLSDDGNTYLWMRNGEYEMVSYSYMSSDIAEEISDIMHGDDGIDLDSVKLKYKVYDYVDSTPYLANYYNWIDSNPYSGFVLMDVQKPYVARTKLNVPVASSGSRVECLFEPVCDNQKVNVVFEIAPKEKGVTIDSIHAEMAGIGTEKVLGTGAVSIENTGKVLFTPVCSDTKEGVSSMEVKGSFYATGIVRSSGQGKTVGPGIMQLNIYAHTEEEFVIGDRVVTIPYRKIFRANINLYNTLETTPSLVYDADLDGFVPSAPEITLRIGQLLQITRDGVISNPESRLDYWVDGGTLYIDI